MNRNPTTFWEHVYNLRERGQITRTWKPGDLARHLEDTFAANNISVNPYNSSISIEGDKIGDYVKKGGQPKAWRVGRGQFQLTEDPDDDIETQRAQMELATGRAEQLRTRNKRTLVRYAEVPSPSLHRPSPKPKSESVSSSLYPTIPITPTEDLRRKMVGLRTEQKAVAIVRSYLLAKYGGRAEIKKDRDGADLKVTIDRKTERIEVKGTEKSDIAWSQLKVSSQQSHDALASGDVSIYRVVDVNSANPRIYILTYGKHFMLEPEPRWAVKRVSPKDERYPLRGEPYHYERPFDAVASDDWEILQ